MINIISPLKSIDVQDFKAGNISEFTLDLDYKNSREVKPGYWIRPTFVVNNFGFIDKIFTDPFDDKLMSVSFSSNGGISFSNFEIDYQNKSSVINLEPMNSTSGVFLNPVLRINSAGFVTEASNGEDTDLPTKGTVKVITVYSGTLKKWVEDPYKNVSCHFELYNYITNPGTFNFIEMTVNEFGFITSIKSDAITVKAENSALVVTPEKDSDKSAYNIGLNTDIIKDGERTYVDEGSPKNITVNLYGQILKVSNTYQWNVGDIGVLPGKKMYKTNWNVKSYDPVTVNIPGHSASNIYPFLTSILSDIRWPPFQNYLMAQDALCKATQLMNPLLSCGGTADDKFFVSQYTQPIGHDCDTMWSYFSWGPTPDINAEQAYIHYVGKIVNPGDSGYESSLTVGGIDSNDFQAGNAFIGFTPIVADYKYGYCQKDWSINYYGSEYNASPANVSIKKTSGSSIFYSTLKKPYYHEQVFQGGSYFYYVIKRGRPSLAALNKYKIVGCGTAGKNNEESIFSNNHVSIIKKDDRIRAGDYVFLSVGSSNDNNIAAVGTYLSNESDIDYARNMGPVLCEVSDGQFSFLAMSKIYSSHGSDQSDPVIVTDYNAWFYYVIIRENS